ncbi:MFS transporter [Virgisporangium ochraceum]|uniref:MFS transporter n=1 Tax=Virgisporangium ochraceum TaxID=65505 RepID=A0A8J3ZQZ6_9ACTN|nr:MFS transporter [Virgisporangium ochraceum]GIJ65930.1 MFS transporter [Virgisporangium ochraceum]
MGLLVIVLAGQFMAILDVTIVNVAITTIQDDLGASGAAMQLVVGGYTIAYAVLMVTGARLGDLGGHRRLFLAGLGLFTVASLACGLAPTTGALIGFRLLQGAGAALMVPQVLSLIQRSFEGAGRARALSVYATVIAGAAVAGQIAGGVLVSLGSGWRPVFLVNVPIGVVLLVAGARWLPRDDHRVARGLDPLGLVTLAGAVLTFVVPLVLGQEQGWPLWCWLGLIASVGLFAAFVAVENRAVGHPLVPARLLRVPGLVRATATLGAMMAAYGGYLFVAAMHLQRGLGFSPLRAGLTFAPGAVAFAVASLNWRRVPARWHRTMIGVGLAVSASGLVVLALALRGGGTGGAALFVGLVLFGGGMGAGFSPLMTRALAGVPLADAADASGVLATVVQLAQVVGVATFGTLMLGLAEGFTPAASGAAFAATALAMGGLMLAGGALIGVRVQARAVATSPPIEG